MTSQTYTLFIIATTLFSGFVFAYSADAAFIQAYPKVPDLPLSLTYTLTIDGQNVPVASFQGHSWAWFSFSGTASVIVTLNQNVSSYTLSPKSYNIQSNSNGNQISFSLNQPRKLILRNVNGLSESLFIFADGPETNAPTLDSPGVFNGASGVQTAIDAASVYPGGGVAYLPAGTHSSFTLKSNVNLYLAPGAIISAGRYLPVSNTQNSKISGRGYIYRSTLQTYNNRNLQISDIMILDSPANALRLGYEVSSGVHNVKIVVGSSFDGMDIDGMFNFIFEDSFIWSGDDNINFMHGADWIDWGRPVNSDGVIFRNSVFYHTRTGHAMVIAPALSWQYIRNVLFENNDVISVHMAMGVHSASGPAEMSGVTFRNSRIEEARNSFVDIISTDHYAWGGCTAGFWSHESSRITNILFDNITVDNQVSNAPPNNNFIIGRSPTQNVDNVTFNNVRVNGKLLTSASDAGINIGSYVTNVKFTNNTSPVPLPVALPKNTSIPSPTIDPYCFSIGYVSHKSVLADPSYLIPSIFPGGTSSTPTPTPTPSTLRGDLNRDGIVNSLDWSIMNSRWFTSDSTADLNKDGIVNSLDFSIMNGNWLKSG